MADVLERLNAVLADRYRLERELGEGGMATVYLAEDLRHHRPVAVKVLRPELAATVGADRFLREIEIAARLHHPHILPLYDSGEAAGFLFYVMPFEEGHSLREKLEREGELPVADVVHLLRDVLDALAHAHARGVVHRDIKPENILLADRHALVTDFGVAKALSDAGGSQQLTTRGIAIGTPAYMAPEQAAADPNVDHRADIYAVGVVAYELLTGQPPFEGRTAAQVLAAQVIQAPLPVTERRPAVPPALAQLVMQCLEKKAADRPQDAAGLVQRLEALLTPAAGTTPVDAGPATGAGARRWPRRRTVVLGGAMLAGLAAAGALAFWPRPAPLPDASVREPVVVLPFEVRSTDPALQGLGIDAADRIATAIEANALGRVVRYQAAGGAGAITDAAVRRVAAETPAGTLITGVIASRGGRLEYQARVLAGSSLQPIWALGPERAPTGDPTPALDALLERILGAVAWRLGPLGQNSSTGGGLYEPPPNLEVARFGVRALGAFFQTRYDEAIPLIRENFARDTTWLSPVVNLGTAYMLTGRWQQRDSVIAFLQERRARLSRGSELTLDWLQASLASPEEELQAARAQATAAPSTAFLALLSSYYARRPAEALEWYARRDTSTTGPRYQLWDRLAALVYHMMGSFDEELALARTALGSEPRFYGHWDREVSALAALGRAPELERVITASYGLEQQGAPARLMGAAALEFSRHEHQAAARSYAERTLAALAEWPDSLQAGADAQTLRRNALRILGRKAELVQSYGQSKRAPASLTLRLLAARDRILAGDTAGVRALADSAVTEPLTAFAGSGWVTPGVPRYYGAQLLALLGRKEEAVAMLRDALNHGARFEADEPRLWYWQPVRDYPPFQELVRIR